MGWDFPAAAIWRATNNGVYFDIMDLARMRSTPSWVSSSWNGIGDAFLTYAYFTGADQWLSGAYPIGGTDPTFFDQK